MIKLPERINGFPNKQQFLELLEEYADAFPEIRKNVIRDASAEPTLWSVLWESSLYKHFHINGFQFNKEYLRKDHQNGPDLCVLHEGKKIWIEAVVPQPTGLPSEWLDKNRKSAFRFPSKEMLLRHTSVLRDKNEQYMHRLKKMNGLIGNNDTYVIAINSILLSSFPTDIYGISQTPFIVEAAFAVGPLQIKISRETNKIVSSSHSAVYHVRKENDSIIDTGVFYKEEYSGISSVIGCNQILLDKKLTLYVAHNPLSATRIQKGILGAYQEWNCKVSDDGLDYLISSEKFQ